MSDIQKNSEAAIARAKDFLAGTQTATNIATPAQTESFVTAADVQRDAQAYQPSHGAPSEGGESVSALDSMSMGLTARAIQLVYPGEALPEYIGRSKNGLSVPQNNIALPVKEVLYSDQEKVMDTSSLDRLAFTKVYNRPVEFITIRENMKAHILSAFDHAHQDVAIKHAATKKVEAGFEGKFEKYTSKVKIEVTPFADLDKPREALSTEIKFQSQELAKTVKRSANLSMLFSETLWQDVGYEDAFYQFSEYDQSGALIINGGHRMKSIDPLLVHPNDTEYTIEQIDLSAPRDDVASRLFTIKDYNNLNYRHAKHRFHGNLNLAGGVLPGDLNNDSETTKIFAKFINIAEFYNKPDFAGYANFSASTIAPRIGGKPNLYLAPALYKLFRHQKISPSTQAFSNSLSNQLNELKSVANVYEEPLLYKPSYVAGDTIAYIAYDNCYFMPQVKVTTLVPELDANSQRIGAAANSQMIGDGMHYTYSLGKEGTASQGSVMLSLQASVQGMLLNPFAFLDIKI